MKRLALSAAALAMALPAAANAAPAIYYGKNTVPGGTVSGAPVTAQAAFLAQLTAGVSTEDFESFANGSAPSSLSFAGSGGTIDAAIAAGSGLVYDNSYGGRFATSGTNFFEVSGDFLVTFSAPIAAFGFFGTDIGDFDGQVTLKLLREGQADEIVVIPSTINGPSASLLFFGLIDTANPFTGLQFGNTSAGSDFFGFDDLTIGDVKQVTAPVPEPATWLLMMLGFGLVGGVLRSQRRQKLTVSYS